VDERTKRIAAYAVLYLVWGSTYLALRFAVETLPPFALAAVRVLVAGSVLLAAAASRGARPTWRDLVHAAVVGALLLVGGNASVLWAVQRIPSGVAALVVATTPLWLALMNAPQAGRPTVRTMAGIALGLAGVAILVGPAAFAGSGRVDPLTVLVLLGASLSWSAGSLVQRSARASPLLATGLQMVTGGAMLAVIACAAGELDELSFLREASPRSWASLLYLTVFGSLLGFSAFAWLMRHDDPARVATYAYVNPVVAVLLGALLGGEEVSARVAVAAAVIIAGVVAIVGQRR
jgi:drug/metabolite transporter (DMT)-like permease